MPGVNPSIVREGLRSMRHLLHARMNPTEPTDAMILGTLTHALVFEPLRFAEIAAVFDGDGSKATKAWKEHKASVAPRIPVHPDDLAEIQAMADAVADDPRCSAMVGLKGITEACMTWADAETSVACKSRLDRYIPKGDKPAVILEFKTAFDGSPKGVQRAAESNGWDIAAAMRVDGHKASEGTEVEYWWIVVEKSAPYIVTPYRADAGILAVGRAKYRSVLEKYAACEKSGIWPGYAPPGRGLVLEPSTWAVRDWQVEYETSMENA